MLPLPRRPRDPRRRSLAERRKPYPGFVTEYSEKDVMNVLGAGPIGARHRRPAHLLDGSFPGRQRRASPRREYSNLGRRRPARAGALWRGAEGRLEDPERARPDHRRRPRFAAPEREMFSEQTEALHAKVDSGNSPVSIMARSSSGANRRSSRSSQGTSRTRDRSDEPHGETVRSRDESRQGVASSVVLWSRRPRRFCSARLRRLSLKASSRLPARRRIPTRRRGSRGHGSRP